MAAKKIFIEVELSWAEEQLASWKAYIDAHPLHELKHDIEWKPTKNGGSMPMVIASIQQQGKFLQDTMKNYLSLLSEVDKMRQADEQKKLNLRGSEDASPFEAGEI